MRTRIYLFIAALICLAVVKTMSGQDTGVPAKKNGLYKEQIGGLDVVGNYVDDKKEGNWLTYFPTGILNKLEEYHDGQKNGVYIELDSKGCLVSQAGYKNDLLDGESKY